MKQERLLCETCSKRLVCKFTRSYIEADVRLKSWLSESGRRREDISEVSIFSTGIVCTQYEKGV